MFSKRPPVKWEQELEVLESRKQNQPQHVAVEERPSSEFVALTQAVEEATVDHPRGMDLPRAVEAAEAAMVDHHHHHPLDQEEWEPLAERLEQETIVACGGQTRDSWRSQLLLTVRRASGEFGRRNLSPG